MRVVKDNKERAPLLNTLATDLPDNTELQQNLRGRCDNYASGRPIIIALAAVLFLCGAVAICIQLRHQASIEIPVQKAVPVVAHSLSTSAGAGVTPAPIVIQITPDLLKVSAIMLGHPRLAIINGHSVGEGDTVTVHPLTRSIGIEFRVIRIGDGRIELSDGTQTITAKLAVPKISNEHL